MKQQQSELSSAPRFPHIAQPQHPECPAKTAMRPRRIKVITPCVIHLSHTFYTRCFRGFRLLQGQVVSFLVALSPLLVNLIAYNLFENNRLSRSEGRWRRLEQRY